MGELKQCPLCLEDTVVEGSGVCPICGEVTEEVLRDEPVEEEVEEVAEVDEQPIVDEDPETLDDDED